MMNMIKEISETILKALCIVQFSLFTIHIADAQPAQRRNQAQQQGATARKNSTTLTTRAQISYPATMQMAEDVVWRRDIYRELDLMQGANSGMYYPVEPVGSQMNLFTYLFKLVLSGQVKAYKYNIDGNESFAADNQLKPLSLLDDYNIYYERKDGRLKLDNSDIPSREVKGYYIKESSYFDQNSATFHTKVIALCPIMFREDDFGDGVARYPLFWVKYDDVAPFLTKQTIMTSDINNAATMSMDDYFVKNMYRGKIYKTNNMLGQTLAQYCPTDSAMAKEQQRIEAELKAFEENIWGDKARKDSLDSIAKVEASQPKTKKHRTNRRATGSGNNAEVSATAAGNNGNAAAASRKRSRPASSTSSGGKISVRRQRH